MHVITNKSLRAIANYKDWPLEKVEIKPVEGGFSMNRRALVGYDDQWVFAKEVDEELLPDDGATELAWLKKEYDVTSHINHLQPGIAPDWCELLQEGRLLLLPALRPQDGWKWDVPKGQEQQYIQSVISATQALEKLQFDDADIQLMSMQPYFRDKMIKSNDIEKLLQSVELREQVAIKLRSTLSDSRDEFIKGCLKVAIETLNDEFALRQLYEAAQKLKDQPDDSFSHCDVRSDNIAYNSKTRQTIIVDWNWASYAPAKFGSTEFLINMAYRGLDVSPWHKELNQALLATTIGFYLVRSMYPPLAPGNTLREFQAETAAVALNLFCSTN